MKSSVEAEKDDPDSRAAEDEPNEIKAEDWRGSQDQMPAKITRRERGSCSPFAHEPCRNLCEAAALSRPSEAAGASFDYELLESQVLDGSIDDHGNVQSQRDSPENSRKKRAASKPVMPRLALSKTDLTPQVPGVSVVKKLERLLDDVAKIDVEVQSEVRAVACQSAQAMRYFGQMVPDLEDDVSVERIDGFGTVLQQFLESVKGFLVLVDVAWRQFEENQLEKDRKMERQQEQQQFTRTLSPSKRTRLEQRGQKGRLLSNDRPWEQAEPPHHQHIEDGGGVVRNNASLLLSTPRGFSSFFNVLATSCENGVYVNEHVKE
jgi:hypothetical protein